MVFSATQEMEARSLGGEDPLEEEMATHSSILNQKIPWTVEPGQLQLMGQQRVGHDWAQPSNKKDSASWKLWNANEISNEMPV